MNSLNIHRIEDIKTEVIKLKNSFVKNILVTNDKNEIFEICLFAKERKDLIFRID